MVSLPTLTLLSASVNSAILHVRSPRGHLKDRLLSVLGHTLVALEELGDELPLSVPRNLQALDLAGRR